MSHYWFIKAQSPHLSKIVTSWYTNVKEEESVSLTRKINAKDVNLSLVSEDLIKKIYEEDGWLDSNFWVQQDSRYFKNAFTDSWSFYKEEKYEEVVLKTATRLEYIFRELHTHAKQQDILCIKRHPKSNGLYSFLKSLKGCIYSIDNQRYWELMESYILFDKTDWTVRDKVFHGFNPHLGKEEALNMMAAFYLSLQIEYA